MGNDSRPPGPPPDEGASQSGTSSEAATRLRRILDQALPDVTADEADAGGGTASPRSDEDYYADRPPHHG
ncbi:MAG: hypothetical protein ACH36H_06400 [Candidatus Nanopelagicales bacterium]